VDPNAVDPVEVVRELTGGQGADYALETAGVPGLVAVAYASVRRGGTVVAVGIPPLDAEAHLPAPDLPREEKVVTGSFYGSCRPHVDMPRLLSLYQEGRLPLDRLVSRKYTLDEVNEAFAAMNAGEVARAVIAF
jgi:Zn-dependent alcohol dehydrogenase